MLERFSEHNFHDAEILGICCDFRSSELTLSIEFEPDNILSFVFSGVCRLKFPSLTNWDNLEIQEFTQLKASSTLFKAEVTFLLGFGKPSGFLEFYFEEVAIGR